MTENNGLENHLKTAVDRLILLMVRRGLDPDTARTTAERAQDRILISIGGKIRTESRSGGLHWPNATEPLAALASELFAGAPDFAKSSARERDPEVIERLVQRRKASGDYAG